MAGAKHITCAVETDEHLIRCIVYMDLNMVRAGVVNHPSEWDSSGYHEIQAPRQLKRTFEFVPIPHYSNDLAVDPSE